MTLIERAKGIWKLFTGGNMTKVDKLVLVLALLYCISPIDIVPDVVPVVGWLDDLLIVLASMRHFSKRVDDKETPSARNDDDLVQVDANVV